MARRLALGHFGLTAQPEDRTPWQEGEGQSFWMEYGPGELRLCMQSGESRDRVQRSRRFFWPLGLWMECTLEYLPDAGQSVRLTVTEKERGEPLVRLECGIRGAFEEGPVWAGFFLLSEESGVPKPIELSLDHFAKFIWFNLPMFCYLGQCIAETAQAGGWFGWFILTNNSADLVKGCTAKISCSKRCASRKQFV